MPATAEALLIALVFVTPGFLTVRIREMLVPSVGKPDALQLTLRSITVSLVYIPLWLVAAPHLFLLRQRLSKLADGSAGAVSVLDSGVLVFFTLGLLLPVGIGILWAVGSWNDWYPKVAERLYPTLGLRSPARGVGEDLWDKLWLNRVRQPWLTVYMRDGRIYVGRGVEKKDLATSGGESVWIPGPEVVSIDIHE